MQDYLNNLPPRERLRMLRHYEGAKFSAEGRAVMVTHGDIPYFEDTLEAVPDHLVVVLESFNKAVPTYFYEIDGKPFDVLAQTWKVDPRSACLGLMRRGMFSPEMAHNMRIYAVLGHDMSWELYDHRSLVDEMIRVNEVSQSLLGLRNSYGKPVYKDLQACVDACINSLKDYGGTHIVRFNAPFRKPNPRIDALVTLGIFEDYPPRATTVDADTAAMLSVLNDNNLYSIVEIV